MLFIVATTKVEFTNTADNEIWEECIHQIALGDKTSLCNLYEQTKSAVYGFALSILKNGYDAEDVLQDTYIRIYASAGGYTPQGKPMAWILTIARNLSLMKIRSAKRTIHMRDEDLERCFSERPACSSDDRMVLSAALQKLSSDESQIVILHAIGGLKHREIAQLLEIPLSTTLSRYARALKKLRALLEGGKPI